jgi:hypothetical protein
MKILSIAIAAVLLALPAHATLNISDKPTKNVDCNGGFCFANADNAVLNVNDLEALLATSDIRVLTEDEVLQDIEILAPIAWASSHALSLESNDAIFVRNTITVQGKAHLSLVVAGGPFFRQKGAVHFWDTASKLTIDGDNYHLVRDIDGLSKAITAHPRILVALADDYDAAQDGRYAHPPVAVPFAGTFEGLGNRISNFSILDREDENVGLFASTRRKGVLRNIGMVKAKVRAENTVHNIAGALLAYNGGQVVNCYASGGEVRSDFPSTLGGLVGLSYGYVYNDWAEVSVSGAGKAEAGGLIGNAHHAVFNVYARGDVTAGDESDVGGLIGYNFADVGDSYSTGSVSGGQSASVGGFMGLSQGTVSSNYWDTDTSGTLFGVGGDNITGVTAMTTAELQAALPPGFNPGYWGQKASLNDGLPYLLGSPPRK